MLFKEPFEPVQQISPHPLNAFFRDPDIVKGIIEAGYPNPFVRQDSILSNILDGNHNLILELPHTAGKTTALLMAMLYRVQQEIDAVQVIFFTSDAHCAEKVYKKALLFAKYTQIKISLVTRSSTLDSCHIIIGTPLEICYQVESKCISTDRLAYICGDDADKTLTYKSVWEFIGRVYWQPVIVAAASCMKPDIKRKIGVDSKILSVKRDQLIAKNISSVNILCSNFDMKLSKLSQILAAFEKRNLQTLITVNVSLN